MSDLSLEEYARRFREIPSGNTEGFEKFCKRHLLKEATAVRNEAINRTPVKTGALKASWTIGNEKITLASNISDHKIKKVSVKRATLESITKTGNIYETNISNSQNYASFLEFGTHNEDGSGRMEARNMLSVPLERYDRTVGLRFNEAFTSYLRKKGVL